jgi:hypothetical protein
MDRTDKANFDSLITMQREASKVSHHEINDNLNDYFSSSIWENRFAIHAKLGFNDHEIFLEWKLLNFYHWISSNH